MSHILQYQYFDLKINVKNRVCERFVNTVFMKIVK